MLKLFKKKKTGGTENTAMPNCETEYIDMLLSQIRCRKAHPMIEEEIRGHIETQTEANIAEGMEPEEALQMAVKDMGDPVEAGVSLDAVHRPQPAWNMIILMAVISILSIFVHVVIGVQKEIGENFYGYHGWGYIRRMTLFTVAGFALMLGVYRLDYSFIGKFAKRIGIGMIAVMLLALISGQSVNGARCMIWIPGVGMVSVLYIGFLFVPVYGAIIYDHRGSGYKGFIKALLWMIVPSYFVMRMPSLNTAVQIFYCMAVMLTMAVVKGWFRIHKKGVLAGLWGTIVLLLAGMLAAALKTGIFLAEYQRMRLQVFLDGGISEYNYIGMMLKELLAGSKLFGRSPGGLELIQGNKLPGFDSEYILI